MEKFIIYESEVSDIHDSNKYEIVGITTDSKTFIANGILTHNKTGCTGPAGYTETNKTINVQYTYGTANLPISVEVNVITRSNCVYSYHQIVNGSDITPTGGGSISISMPNPDSITNLCSKVVQLRSTGANLNSLYNNYTASLTATDGAGRIATGSFTLKASVSCLTPETILEKFDGSLILLKDVEIGDEIKTIDLENMKIKKTIVTHKIIAHSDKIYKINDGLINSTHNHQHIVKRKDDWKILEPSQLILGDSYLTKDFELIEIYKIEILS